MKNENFKWKIMIRYIILIILTQALLFFWSQSILPDKKKDILYIPDGNEYDIEGIAECSQIIDYEYDDEGKLIHLYGYHEKDDNSGNWSMQYENVYTYDNKGRLVEDKYYLSYISREEPRNVTTYSYDTDGSYTKVKSYKSNSSDSSTNKGYSYYSEIEDVIEIYDKDGLLINKNNKLFYTYDENGKLIKIDMYDKGKFLGETIINWDDDAYQSVEIMWLEKDIYAVWADQYNKDWQQVSGIWYKGTLDSFDLTYYDIERMGKPYYSANYYHGNMVEELFNARTKDMINGYNALSYKVSDYNDKGKIIWHSYIALSGSKIYAEQYLYGDSDKISREIHYNIRGELQYNLQDGSTISFYKDETNYLTDIIRMSKTGKVISQYKFDKNHKLILPKEENDMIINDIDNDIYVVQSGDSLYSIAHDCYGDDNR